MQSKTSKKPSSPSPWKAVSHCSEAQVSEIARNLASELRLGHRVFLEGPMGSGKTTFARALLFGLGVLQPPEGSPTFALAHEYESPAGGIAHLDFYRLRSTLEIEEAGIPAYFWERDLIVISEWISEWPEFERQVSEGHTTWQVKLAFEEGADSTRSVKIWVIESLFRNSQ